MSAPWVFSLLLGWSEDFQPSPVPDWRWGVGSWSVCFDGGKAFMCLCFYRVGQAPPQGVPAPLVCAPHLVPAALDTVPRVGRGRASDVCESVPRFFPGSQRVRGPWATQLLPVGNRRCPGSGETPQPPPSREPQ